MFIKFGLNEFNDCAVTMSSGGGGAIPQIIDSLTERDLS